MKKKILLTFILFALMSTKVFAGAAPINIPARIPSTIPDSNADVYAAAFIDSFNYSDISFTNTKQGGTDIEGSGVFRKIFVTAKPNESEITTNLTASADQNDKVNAFNDIIGNDGFSAYCLNGDINVPEYNELSFYGEDTAEDELKMRIIFALYNDKSLYNVFKSVVGFDSFYNEKVTYTLTTETTASEAMTKYYSGQDVIVNVQNIKLAKGILNPELKTITAADLKGEAGATDFQVKLNLKDLALNKYSTTIDNVENYDKALWIVEHSYPTLTLDQTYEQVNSSYELALSEMLILSSRGGTYESKVEYMNTTTKDAKNEDVTNLKRMEDSIKRLKLCSNDLLGESASTEKGYIAKDLNDYMNTYFEIGDYLPNGKTEYTGADITKNICSNVLKFYEKFSSIEQYTYSTIQYAIWKVSDGYTAQDGGKLGDTLKGSTELNKLYQYLIKDRTETTNYSKLTFTNTFNLTKPESGKEIYKEETDYYMYGPYKVTGDILSIESILTSIDGTVNGASIVNKDGNAITETKLGEEFYIKCNKSDKVANLKIKLTGKNAKSFSPSTNRARVYYANNPMLQNVMSGGKIVDVTVENSFDLVFNPKTGVNNLAIIFIISIVAFTLGYIVINSRSQEINL